MTNTTQKPKFEEMIPWTGGECPWNGLVYFTTSSNKEVVKENYSKDLKWNYVGYADIIAYMPVMLWEEGYRRPLEFVERKGTDKVVLHSGVILTSDEFFENDDLNEILLYKPKSQQWNPTASMLDDLAKHCAKNREERMKTNSTGSWKEVECSRPKDFIGNNLFEGVCLEDLFGLYQDYKREKESAENMMAKVIQEIEYRTPDEWNIELKGLQIGLEESSSEEAPSENPEEALVNDWQNWCKGDILKCVEANDEVLTTGKYYTIEDMDYSDPENPVRINDDDGDCMWLCLELDGNFIKISTKIEA